MKNARKLKSIWQDGEFSELLPLLEARVDKFMQKILPSFPFLKEFAADIKNDALMAVVVSHKNRSHPNNPSFYISRVIVRAIEISMQDILSYQKLTEPLAAVHDKIAVHPSLDQAILIKEREITVRKVLATLPERSANIINLRFTEDYTLNETAEHVPRRDAPVFPNIHSHDPLTREAIRQLESKALRDLRMPRRRQMLEPYADLGF